MTIREEDAERALRQVIDPEVGLDVLTMGMIYGVTETASGHLHVTMTLTTRGCPLGAFLTGQVEDALRAVGGVDAVTVELVRDPPWSPSMIDRTSLE